MARYLIATKYKKDGSPLKKQPADVFRKMLKSQKIAFEERHIQITPPVVEPVSFMGDPPVVEPVSFMGDPLKNECWDRPRFVTDKHYNRVPAKTFREVSSLNLETATEFTFHDQGKL